jgi:hypothetical protein
MQQCTARLRTRGERRAVGEMTYGSNRCSNLE